MNFLRKYLGLILVFGAFIVGITTYKGYGVSWDEGDQIHLGTVNYEYLFQHKGAVESCDNKEYGVAFELPLAIIQHSLGLTDSRDNLLMRHLVTHLFFLLGALAFFLLIDYLYSNKLLATLGFLMLLTTPLIYGHSFFNTKDVPFLSMFIICFLVAAVAFRKNTIKWYIMLGIAAALLMNMRIMGILFELCIICFFVFDLIALRKDKATRKKTLVSALVFIGVSFAFLSLTWPYLYPNPAKNFIDAFLRLSQWPWNGYVLFWGKTVECKALPFYYAVSWFCISNPLIYVVLGTFGIVYFIIQFLKRPGQFFFDKTARNQALYAFCFLEPLIAVLAFHSAIFDTWRHLYFIYPSFLLAGIYGLNYLFNTKARPVALFLVSAAIAYSGFYMVSNYPYEHVYFNELVTKRTEPEYLRKNFEMDYWGTSYARAFGYILKHDTSKNITVAVQGGMGIGMQNTWILPAEDRKRIHLTEDIAQANYFASYYRQHSEDYPFQKKEVFSIKVLNSTIMSVFKLK